MSENSIYYLLPALSFMIGLLVGDLSARYTIGKKFKLIDEFIFKTRGIRPIKETLDLLEKRKKNKGG